MHALIYLDHVNTLDPAHYHPANLEARILCKDRELLARHGGHPREAGHEPRQYSGKAQDDRQENALQLFFRKRKKPHQPVDHGAAGAARTPDPRPIALRTRLPAHAGRLAPYCAATHFSSLPAECASASAMMSSTSSAYEMPQCFACSGTRLSGVIPG